MNDQPENKPPQTRPKGAAFVLAGLGLFLLVGAVDSVRLHDAYAIGWGLGIAGLALIGLGVRWGTKQP